MVLADSIVDLQVHSYLLLMLVDVGVEMIVLSSCPLNQTGALTLLYDSLIPHYLGNSK